jgi:hypothetical protein
MRGVWREYEQVYSMLHAVCYHIRGDVTPVTVHDEKAMEYWVSWSGRGLENSSQPLVGVAVRRPTAVTRREPPVPWCMCRYPAGISVFRLEDEKRWKRRATTMHSIAVIHCYRPEMTFQVDFSRMLTKDLDD